MARATDNAFQVGIDASVAFEAIDELLDVAARSRVGSDALNSAYWQAVTAIVVMIETGSDWLAEAEGAAKKTARAVIQTGVEVSHDLFSNLLWPVPPRGRSGPSSLVQAWRKMQALTRRLG